MNRIPSLLGLTVTAALALPAVAGATTLCVNNPAGCTGTAVSSANLESNALGGAHRFDGQPDLVMIGPGTYTDTGTFVPSGDDALEIRGSGMGQTTLTSSGSTNIAVIRVNNVDGETIMRDLTVAIPASFPDSGGNGSAIGSGGGLFERVRVTSANPTSNGITINRPMTLRAMDITSDEGTAIRANAATTLEDSVVSSDDGIDNGQEFAPMTVRRSRFVMGGDGYSQAMYNRRSTSSISDSVIEIAADGTNESIAISTWSDSGVEAVTNVDHVTIVRKGATVATTLAFDSYAIDGQAGKASTVVTNSIVRGVAATARRYAGTAPADGAATVELRHSNAPATHLETGKGSVVRSTGMIDADPNFGPGYRLEAGSPSIDAGDPAFAAGGTDRDGAPRVTDGDANKTIVTDQGAFERPGPTSYPADPTASTPGGTTGGTTGTTDTTQQTPKGLPLPTLALAARFGRLRGASLVRRGRSYVVRTGIEAVCAAGGPACQGAVVASGATAKAAQKKAGATVLGRSSTAIAAGATAKLTVTLNKAAVKRLRRAKRLRVTLAVTVTKRGFASATSGRTITVKLPKRR